MTRSAYVRRIIAIDKENIKGMDILRVCLYGYVPGSIWPSLHLRKYLLLNPEDKGAASFELGQAYYAKGDFAKAIEYFERVRTAGPRAAALLEADILKYRHGTLGFRSLNSMQSLLGMLLECYKKTGNMAKAAEIQKEYDFYKNKHSRYCFNKRYKFF